MKETYDLRMRAQYADLILGSFQLSNDRSKRLSPDVHQVIGEVGDALYCKVREDANLLKDEPFANRPVCGCSVTRTYTKKETDAAELLLVHSFYQYGAAEEYGTWYTDAPEKPDCGINRQELRVIRYSPFQSVIEDKKNLACALGSRQIGPLHYPFGKLTKRDLISLWGGETVVSERLVSLIESGGFRGGRIDPIWNTASGAKALPALAETETGAKLIARAGVLGMKTSDREFWRWLESAEQLSAFEKALWEEKKVAGDKRPAAPPSHRYFQLRVESPPLAVTGPTVFNDSFFGGLQHQCKCGFGEIYGNISSRLYVKRSSWDGADICQTDLFFGGRQGLFRPHRQLIVSKRLFEALQQNKITKVAFEIVELV
jgi:hypothetical protein